ncbi:RidA family protein [Parasulfitobacter algicola]|uniref:RidA family protein n=1 Tax=Parasulfitobacter algicola TaxID=2614809 RepID=A0ABX2IQ36_9RHOB|nr:RidA family protein [Sulfitobacter algicola]NSX54991.1 RidA family protein [Sulfitobacter algicola]
MPKGFETEKVWGARGRGFQMGVIQPKGIVVHLTGQVAWSADEEIIGLGDVEKQARQCFRNIQFLLHEIGGNLSDVISITTYFTDRSQLKHIQKVRAEFFHPGSEPVSTSVMVAGLGHKDFLVELTPIAVISHDRFIDPD